MKNPKILENATSLEPVISSGHDHTFKKSHDLGIHSDFEPVCVNWYDQTVYGIIIEATQTYIRVCLKDNPQNTLSQHAHFSGVSSFVSFIHQYSYLQKTNDGKIELSDNGKQTAIKLIQKLCDLQHKSDLISNIHIASKMPDGETIYSGFPGIQMSYQGEVLHGIVTGASRHRITVRLEGYPQTAELAKAIGVGDFDEHLALFYKQHIPMLLSYQQTAVLSEHGEAMAQYLMKKIYHLYHQPIETRQPNNSEAQLADSGAANSYEFIDILTPLKEKLPEIKKHCEQIYILKLNPLYHKRSQLKRQFKAGIISESEYKRRRHDLSTEISRLKMKEQADIVRAVICYLKTKFNIRKIDAIQYCYCVGVLPFSNK